MYSCVLAVLQQSVAGSVQGELASAEDMQGLEQQLAASTSECRRWAASLEQALLQGHLGMVRSAVVGSLQRQQWQSQRQPATWPADAG